MRASTKIPFSTKKLHVIFACSSVALLLSIVWWIKVDYARPWRAFQDEFIDLQASLAYFDALAQTREHGNDARAEYEQLSDRTRRRLINMPLVDFAAPRGTPGRHEIRQVVLPDIRVELSFVQGVQVDRCMTCHIAVADKNFTRQNLAKRLERALVTMNQERRRQGQQELALPSVAGRNDLKPGAITPTWRSLTEPQHEKCFRSLVNQINTFQTMRGAALLNVAQPFLAHPKFDLYVSENSPHPMSQMGCTVCHEGNGEETDFVLAAHIPRSPEQRRKWADKYYVRTAELVPEQMWHTVERYWDRPMLPPTYSEANCAKCHSLISDMSTYDLQPAAQRINEGRFLFSTLGCANCHRVAELADARRVGPDLRHVSAKLTRGFIHNWIYQPKAYRFSTNMPHFFGQENNDAWSGTSGDELDPELRTKTEVVAITEYLLAIQEDYDKDPLPEDLWRSLQNESSEAVITAADRGRRLFGSVGCLACHATLAYAPNNDEGVAGEMLGTQWIVDDLAGRKLPADADELAALSNEAYDAIFDAAHQKNGKMTYADRVEYAMTHFDSAYGTMFDPNRVDPARSDVPVFTRLAGELSRMRMKLKDYQHAVTWLYDWLRNPRHYSRYTTMPRMRLERRNLPAIGPETGRATGEVIEIDEALDMAVYLSTLDANGGNEADVHLRRESQDSDGFSMKPFDTSEADRQVLATKRDELLRNVLSDLSSDAGAVSSPSDATGVMAKELIAKLASSSLSQAEARIRIETMNPDRLRWVYLGNRMVGHYGCYSCHLIPGHEVAARPGPELTGWGEKQLSQLDFAAFDPAIQKQRKPDQGYEHLYERDLERPDTRAQLIRWAWNDNPPIRVERSRASFGWHKLRNPRLWDRYQYKAPYDRLKMPNLFVDSDQAHALVTFLLSRKPPRVNETIQVDYTSTPAGKIARGRNLARDLNCVACHKIDGNTAVAYQYFKIDQAGELRFDEANAPPWLRGEGCRVRSDRLYSFLNEVGSIRPWLRVRMPSFDLTHEQATTLAEYFVGLSQHESQWLEEQLRCVQRDIADADKPTDDDWYRRESLERQADLLRRYAVANRLIPSAAVGPETHPEKLAAAYAHIVQHAEFFKTLNKVTYPFTDAPPKSVSPDDLADGKQLFYVMGCLKCHVFGDLSAAGANATPTAPNLQRVHKRLRREWVRHWLAGPTRIKPGTAMPNFFGDDGSGAFTERPQKDRERIRMLLSDRDPKMPGRQTILDDSDRQIEAITKFLYDASEKKWNIVQPAGPDYPAVDG